MTPALVTIARENLASARDLEIRCNDVRLVRADARRHRFPPGDLVVFLYNPFDGEALDAVLDRIACRRRRSAEWILYHTPVHGDRITARGYETVTALPEGTVYSGWRDNANALASCASSAGEK
jgi:hypothetical protein